MVKAVGFMESLASASIGHVRRDSRHETPFSPTLDANLVGLILKLQKLYDSGKRDFVIVTHRDPDPDAIAGCLGMERLIRGILPPDITVQWMHDGALCPLVRKTCRHVSESIAKLPLLLETPEGVERTAVILVDQPLLDLPSVLPPVMQRQKILSQYKPDITLDHHGEDRFDDGVVVAVSAGSTAVLVQRLLELAKSHSRFCHARTSAEDDAELALFINIGARTDAGVAVVGTLPENASKYLTWVDQETQALVDPAVAARFDLLDEHHAFLVAAARRNAQVYHGVYIGEHPVHLVLTFAGVADTSHCIGACATKVMDSERNSETGGLPVAVVVCGIVREQEDLSHRLHAGDLVHISIRTDEPVSAALIAHILSVGGGGRPGAASAQIRIPRWYDAEREELFLRDCLALMAVKLTWNEKFTWTLDWDDASAPLALLKEVAKEDPRVI
jgi:nanoRNase/pAp phosphatase (c-di-AMP/oligoRNAs hydrolase)